MNAELKAVWEVYRPFRKHILISLSLLGAAQAFGLAFQLVAGKVFNIVVYKQGLGLLTYWCIGLALLYVIAGELARIRDRFELNHLDFDIKRSMRKMTSRHMLSLSIGQHHSEHSGVKQRIVGEGESAIINTFKLTAYEISPMLFEIGLCAIACPFFDPLLGSLVAVSVIYTAYLSREATQRYIGPIETQDKVEEKTSKLAREIVQNVELIKLNSKEEFAVSEQDRLISGINQGWKGIWIPYSNLLWDMAYFPRMMRVVVMFFAGLRAYQGDISYGAAIIIWRLADNSIGRVGTLSYLQRAWAMNIPKIKRYVEFLRILPDVKNAPDALKVPRFMGAIEFRNVSFRYPTKPLMKEEEDKPSKRPERELAVDDVSFVCEPGRSYAIVGTSGAGKSTLKHLAVRSYDPTAGVIAFDGYPLTQLDLEMMRSRIGVVDQEVPLLDRSLRENLAFLLPEGAKVSDDDIWRACKMACIDRFASRLEQGLDTLIGERGVKLSGGERQRVAIARAILKDPDVFIFDEATSSLDALNEDDIVQSIKSVSKGKTTIMIAHRFSTILSADEIIVMEGGKVVGQGTHKELYATCSAYRALVGPQIKIVRSLELVS